MALALLKEDAVTYEVIAEKLQEQLRPEKSALIAKYKFDNCASNPGESVNHYVATLKQLATECKFGETMRKKRLRDCLVFGPSLHCLEFPALPWQRLHVDFAGPDKGMMLKVVIDAHSKWPEIFMMANTTAEETVDTLHSLFVRFGLPDQIVSDNGPQFMSGVFKSFVKENGTLPSSNQLA